MITRKKKKGTTGGKHAIAKKAKSSKRPGRKTSGNIIMTMLAVGAAGVMGYLGWQYFKKRKSVQQPDMDVLLPGPSKVLPDLVSLPGTPPYQPATISPEITFPKPKPSTSAPGSGIVFPLKKGQKNEQVRALQQALIAKHGRQILPKYGADGDFGSETVTALTKLGHPSTITESLFNVLVQSSAIDASSTGHQLFTAAQQKDFTKVLALLKSLSNKEVYSQASKTFQEGRLNGGVRQTLVNGLLNTFTQESQKEKIRYEFIRMGLLYDGKKWSLEGLDGTVLITKEPAIVWANATQKMQVPAKTVLGTEVTKRLDYTVFINNKKYFLVQTKSVKYL